MNKQFRRFIRYCTSCNRRTAAGLVVGLAIVVTVTSINLILAAKQRSAVASLHRHGYLVEYRHELTNVAYRADAANPPGPPVIRDVLGTDFFDRPIAAKLYGRSGILIADDDLSQLSALPSIRLVHIQSFDVTDEGLRHLSLLKNLEYLILSTHQITDAGLPHLATLTNLRRLRISGHHLTRDGLRKLAEALPNCAISYDSRTFDWAHTPSGWYPPSDWPAPWKERALRF